MTDIRLIASKISRISREMQDYNNHLYKSRSTSIVSMRSTKFNEWISRLEMIVNELEDRGPFVEEGDR